MSAYVSSRHVAFLLIFVALIVIGYEIKQWLQIDLASSYQFGLSSHRAYQQPEKSAQETDANANALQILQFNMQAYNDRPVFSPNRKMPDNAHSVKNAPVQPTPANSSSSSVEDIELVGVVKDDQGVSVYLTKKGQNIATKHKINDEFAGWKVVSIEGTAVLLTKDGNSLEKQLDWQTDRLKPRSIPIAAAKESKSQKKQNEDKKALVNPFVKALESSMKKD